MADLFSVVVLLYRNREYVEDCLRSILIQDYGDIEILVVDDGSEVFDPASIEAYIRNHQRGNIRSSMVYQNQRNLGTVKSANGAIKRASGCFLKLLAADDALYDSHTLSHAAEALRRAPCGVVTGDVMRCDETLRPVGRYRNALPASLNDLDPEEVFRRLCVHNDIVAGGVFFARRFFDRCGLFDEGYRLLEDWPTWLNAAHSGCRFLYAPFYAVRYRSNGGIGTGSNPDYMADKRRVLERIIIPAKKELGLWWYWKARLSFLLINNRRVRDVYRILFRKKQP